LVGPKPAFGRVHEGLIDLLSDLSHRQIL